MKWISCIQPTETNLPFYPLITVNCAPMGVANATVLALCHQIYTIRIHIICIICQQRH